MREIKFRAWDKENNCWFVPTCEAYRGKLEELLIGLSGRLCLRTESGVFDESTLAGQYVLMQYTGLKDKHGREIYEGDILRDFRKGTVASVKWHGSMAGFIAQQPKEAGEATHEWGELFRVFDRCEVIGNIYEHPELVQ